MVQFSSLDLGINLSHIALETNAVWAITRDHKVWFRLVKFNLVHQIQAQTRVILHYEPMQCGLSLGIIRYGSV